jgi:hypothetical protein
VPFHFHRVYRYRRDMPDASPFFGLALGIYPVQTDLPVGMKGASAWAMLDCGHPHLLYGKIERASDDAIEVQSGDGVQYVFEVLTLDRLSEMKGNIPQYDLIRQRVDSDHALQLMYLMDGLEDWYVEEYEHKTRGASEG